MICRFDDLTAADTNDACVPAFPRNWSAAPLVMNSAIVSSDRLRHRAVQPFAKRFGGSDDLYRELLFVEFFLGSLLLPSGNGGQRGSANQDAALMGIIHGGQFPFPCDAGPRESMDSKQVKYILGQVLASVPYCTDWSFF